MKSAKTTTVNKPKTTGGAVPKTTGTTVRFGWAVVNAPRLSQAQISRNVEAGTKALVRAAPKISQAGIYIEVGSKVPMYRADPKNPTRLIRELNGKTSIGTFVGGKFKASTKK